MNLDLIITFLFFGTLIANLVHWRFRKGEPFCHYPSKGRLFKFQFIWLALVMGLGTALLFGRVSSLLHSVVSNGGLIFWMIYSIWVRHLMRCASA